MRGAIHEVTVVGPGEQVRDSELRWSDLGRPFVVRGHVAVYRSGAREIEVADQNAARVDIVFAAPRDSGIRQGFKLEIRNVSPALDGDYRVTGVKDVVKHLRVFGERLTVDEGS